MPSRYNLTYREKKGAESGLLASEHKQNIAGAADLQDQRNKTAQTVKVTQW